MTIRNAATTAATPAPNGSALRAAYLETRARTEMLAADLSAEDQCVQSMPDASPAKWHRAHTTWFFETFIALPHIAGYTAFDPRFQMLFNSYYQAVGARHPRPARGLLTRPDADEVCRYRCAVDQAMLDALDLLPPAAIALVELGLQHEQQHQELLVTDILHAFAQNPLAPACLPGWTEPVGEADPTRMIEMEGGIAGLGARTADGFAFDNEMPHHRVLLQPYRLASRLVRNSEFAAFIADGGYRTPSLWMSDGWDRAQQEGWSAPLYWRQEEHGAAWQQMTPGGVRALDPDAPLRHVSWYEADAFARWAGCRLPTEAELETAQTSATCGCTEFTGHVWQWTGSAYLPYPGFRAAPGAVGEYNGKFMINQMVLRGGASITAPGHARPSYRNFFPPEKRWQFTGLRLAADAQPGTPA
jgi:ergothioneine biosynthesis protein EgtB